MKGAEYGEDGMTSKTPLLGHSKVAVYGGAAGGVAGADMVADTPSQSYMTPMWAPSGFDRDTVQHFTLDGGEPQYPPSQAGSVHGMPTSNDPGQVTRFLAAILAGLVSVVDNAPYGLVLFPLEIREEYKGVGVAMVLTSCAIPQVVFTWTSVFPCAVGCMVVENLPFLARLGRDVYSDLKARGREDQVLPTLLFCFALSTVLSGITMLLLGRARLGKLTAYFPKHVLLGYVGGMGVFIFTAGFEITTDRTWTWNPFALLRSVYGPPGSLLAVTLALVAAIPVLKRLTRNSTLTLPLFFLAIPCFFWAILLSYGLTAQHAKDNMWVITVGSAPGLPGLLPWVMVNPFLIAWDVVASQMFTIVGIVLFTMLHVPVNVPALSLTCGRPCYIDAELSSQGIANIVCGCFGALQCYLVYGVSALYFKCGGGGKKESLIIASIVLFFAAAGGDAMSLLPRPLAGCVCMHVGLDLMHEVFVDSLRSITLWEYAQVLGVVAVIEASGFMEGLGFGLLLACFAYILATSQENPVDVSAPAGSIRSRVMRSLDDRRKLHILLDKHVWVLRVKGGSLFFGNSVRLAEHCEELLETVSDLKFLVLHFPSQMHGADCTAVASLAELVASCERHRVYAVFAELNDDLRRRVEVALPNPKTRYAMWFLSMNDAFTFIEARLLQPTRNSYQPREKASAAELLRHLAPDQPAESINSLAKYFKKESAREGETVWRKGEKPTRAVLVSVGLLLADPLTNEPPEPIHPGGIAGELGLITGESRFHTLVAAENTSFFSAGRELFADPLAVIVFQQIALNFASHRLHHLNLFGRIPAV